MLEELQIALDMGGCSSKFKYSEFLLDKQSKLQIDDLDLVYELFSQHTKKIAIYSWYKEPDHLSNYQELFEKEQKLSDLDIYIRPDTISIYRLNRDSSYVGWLKEQGIKKAKVTFVGLESNSNYFIGRPGAYKELLNALNILVDNEIIPEIEIIINKKNLSDLKKLLALIDKMEIKQRVEAFGGKFIIYAKVGRPTGENLKNIAYRITEKDLWQIPEKLLLETKKIDKSDILFGMPEHKLYEKYIKKAEYINIKKNKLKLYIDYRFDVYFLNTNPYFKLGNLKQNQVNEILDNYMNNKSFIQNVSVSIKINELVKEFGNQNGIWLFKEEDYLLYLLELYCQKYYCKK